MILLYKSQCIRFGIKSMLYYSMVHHDAENHIRPIIFQCSNSAQMTVVHVTTGSRLRKWRENNKLARVKYLRNLEVYAVIQLCQDIQKHPTSPSVSTKIGAGTNCECGSFVEQALLYGFYFQASWRGAHRSISWSHSRSV